MEAPRIAVVWRHETAQCATSRPNPARWRSRQCNFWKLRIWLAEVEAAV